jgi:hypothetical protein
MLIVDSQQLTWNPETKTFTVEASELEAAVKNHPCYRDRIMQVNGRWGFFVRSARTGNTQWFERCREQRDSEGVLESVVFIAPGLQDVKLVVWND